MNHTIYTIGHSNHEADDFVRILESHSVKAVADLRTSPYSRMYPQFNRQPLQAVLKRAGIRYVFMGDVLGGRPDDLSCYENGKVRYDKVAQLPAFSEGLDRVLRGAAQYRIALMCSEKDPITCHRMLLVSRELAKRGAAVAHILHDGTLEPHAEAEMRMMDAAKVPREDLFEPLSALLARAYALQSQACAADAPDPGAPPPPQENAP